MLNSAVKLPLVLAVLLACLGMSFHGEYFAFLDFYNQKRVLQIVLMAVVIFFAVTEQSFFKWLFCIIKKWKHLAAAFFVFFAIGLVSSLFTVYKYHAIHNWLEYFYIFIFTLALLYFFIKNNGVLKIIIYAIFIFVFLYLFKFSFLLVMGVVLHGIVNCKLLVTGVVNENFIAQPLGMLCLFFAAYGLAAQKKYAWVSYALFFASILFMLVIYNRAVLLSTGIVVLFWAIYCRNAFAYRLCALYFSCLCAGVAIFWILMMNVDIAYSQYQIQSIGSSAGRTTLWMAAFNDLKSNLLLGAGPYSFTFDSPMAISHPHNIYMQLLAEWGLIATIAIGVPIVCIFFNLAKNAKKTTSPPLMVCGFLALLEGLLHAGLSGIFVMPLAQTIFCIIFALTMAQYYTSTDMTESIGAKLYGFKNIFLLNSMRIFLVLGFSVFLLLGYNLSLQNPSNCVVNAGPRYWVDGGVIPCR